MKKIIALLLPAVFLVACNRTTAEPRAEAAPAPPAAAVPAAAKTPANLTGQVVETMNAGGYTYVKLRAGSSEQWAAVTQAEVKTGDTITIVPSMTAEKFESKTLNRTFDTIVFGTLDSGRAAAAAPVAQATQHMSGPADAGDVQVARAEGGKTVAEIWAGSAALKDQQVIVRGKVVKSLSGIMGRNWIHIRDGSGSREKGDDDLTVTTDEKAAVGDVVVVTGVLRADKDFGAGYRYPVIVENAKLTK